MNCIFPQNLKGSPPHTRGQALAAAGTSRKSRITPAHAGTSSCASICFVSTAGSPPHTRGQAEFWLHWQAFGRITPAHAGTSFSKALAIRASRDHPRTRGDKSDRLDYGAVEKGSPPHTRGQDETGKSSPGWGGITPAHAGTSPPVIGTSLPGADHPRTRGDKSCAASF